MINSELPNPRSEGLINSAGYIVREITNADRDALAHLLTVEWHVHRHLDWIQPLDLVDKKPFLVLEKDGVLTAALALPPDPPGTHWISLFATTLQVPVVFSWQLLLNAALKITKTNELNSVIAILGLQDWMRKLALDSGFTHIHDILGLEWNRMRVDKNYSSQIVIRQAITEDLPAIGMLDKKCFIPLWQLTEKKLEAAFGLSSYTTVAERDGEVIGYQLSTTQSVSAHLARLAIAPPMQNQGIGRALTLDMLEHFSSIAITDISVNTQSNNHSSLRLYQQLGFVHSGERYPVYTLPIN